MTATSRPAGPADRYGRAAAGPRRLAVLLAGGLLVAVLFGWAVYVGVMVARQPVHWTDVSYSVIDDGHVRITFQVSLKPGHTAMCTVQALNQGFTTVGQLDVKVGPARTDQFTVTTTVPTSERAVNASVKACAAG